MLLRMQPKQVHRRYSGSHTHRGNKCWRARIFASAYSYAGTAIWSIFMRGTPGSFGAISMAGRICAANWSRRVGVAGVVGDMAWILSGATTTPRQCDHHTRIG